MSSSSGCSTSRRQRSICLLAFVEEVHQDLVVDNVVGLLHLPVGGLDDRLLVVDGLAGIEINLGELAQRCAVDSCMLAGVVLVVTVDWIGAESTPLLRIGVTCGNAVLEKVTLDPDQDDTHNVADVHLLQHYKQLVARSVLAVVVKTFS